MDKTEKDIVALCKAIGTDITVQQDIQLAQSLFEVADDAKAAVATLRFILTHAAKYDAERGDLVEELQQLGLQSVVAEALVQSYDDLRSRLQDQQRTQRFQFPGIEKLKWSVKGSSIIRLDLRLDRPTVDCSVTSVPTSRELHVDMTKNKFLALYEDLSYAQSLLGSD